LGRLPGIGSRAAELIVAELKGKMEDIALGAESAAGGDLADLTESQRDAMEIMLAWGDSRTDAERWLERAARVHADITEPDEWVRAAYRVKTGVEG
jgi:Holliday junction resolvasome RuvABC DNA-binding subunit